MSGRARGPPLGPYTVVFRRRGRAGAGVRGGAVAVVQRPAGQLPVGVGAGRGVEGDGERGGTAGRDGSQGSSLWDRVWLGRGGARDSGGGRRGTPRAGGDGDG